MKSALAECRYLCTYKYIFTRIFAQLDFLPLSKNNSTYFKYLCAYLYDGK